MIFSKNTQILNFMNIRPVGSELFHAHGQTDIRTDMEKLRVAFRNLTNVPKNKYRYIETINENKNNCG